MSELKLRILPELEPFHTTQKRYKVAYGGRGSGKSWGIAQLLLILAYSGTERILCCREFQGSIMESVKTLLEGQIQAMGLTHAFDILKNRITCNTTGSVFIFEGLKANVSKIKSMEGITIVWAEEAEKISEESWNTLIPTIREEGSEIWVTFNPHDINDDTYDRFVTNTPPDTYLTKINYKQNPYFPETLRKEMEYMRDKDYELYLHIWEGEPLSDAESAFIKHSWMASAIDAHKELPVFKTNSGKNKLGFDVADEGEDNNAYTHAYGSIVLYSEEWHDGDVGESTRRVFNKARTLSASVVYDAIGVGAGAKAESNRLNATESAGNVSFTPFVAGGVVEYPLSEVSEGMIRTNKDFFSNIKAQKWWTLRQRFYNTYLARTKGKEYKVEELISLSSDNPLTDKLIRELSRPRIAYDNNGRVSVESKQAMAKRNIKSPNIADSLIMCYVSTNNEIYIG